MKICYISHGSFTHIKPYIEYFSKAGNEVFLIKIASGPDYNVKTYDVSIGKTYSTGFDKFKYILSAFKARNIVTKIKPDIVHSHYATSGGLAGLICGFHPTVITVHGSDLTTNKDSLIWKPLLKMIFKQADSVNVVSNDLKKMAVEIGVPQSKIDVLTLGIDTNKFNFKPREPINSQTVLKMVNTRRLEPVYDHPTIIKALGLLKAKNVNFKMTFVGYGELEYQLKDMAKDYKLDKYINFVGGCDNQQMPKYLYENDIYLSASLWDGTSLCLLEAMAAGAFPIVSDIPANSDWLVNGKTGFLHKIGNENDLADCIISYNNQPEIIDNALKINRLLVEQTGDRIKNMQKLEQIYKRLLK